MFRKAYINALLAIMLLAAFGLAQATDKGLFWKLESPTGKTSYLFGTMHTDDNRVAEITPAMDDAIKAVDVFVMENEPVNDPSVFLMKEGNLAQMITDAEFEKVRELADFHSMHLGAAMQMKPWLLAVIFDLPKPQAGFEQDNLLMARAEESNKEVVGIETTQEHFGIMDDFTRGEQMVMLRAVLKRTLAQKEADFERLIAVYLEGDSDKISAQDEQITGGILPKELWAKMRSKLLTERNAVMSKRAVDMANEKAIFVAVGASHLAGEDGLIEAFKKAGFKLSPMAK